VLELLQTGRSNAEIAEALHGGIETVLHARTSRLPQAWRQDPARAPGPGLSGYQLSPQRSPNANSLTALRLSR
jgi:hypothetical protein